MEEKEEKEEEEEGSTIKRIKTSSATDHANSQRSGSSCKENGTWMHTFLKILTDRYRILDGDGRQQRQHIETAGD